MIEINAYITVFGNQKTHKFLLGVFNNIFPEKDMFFIEDNKIVSRYITNPTDLELTQIKDICSVFDLCYLMRWLEESQCYGYTVEYFKKFIYYKMEMSNLLIMKTEKDIIDFLGLNDIYDLQKENIITEDELPG